MNSNFIKNDECVENILNNVNYLLKTGDNSSVDKVLMILKIKNSVDDMIYNEIEKNIWNVDDVILKILVEETKINNKKYLKKENNKNFSIYFYESYIKYFFKRYDNILLSFNDDQQIFNVYIDKIKKNINSIEKLKNKLNNYNVEFTFSIKINQTI